MERERERERGGGEEINNHRLNCDLDSCYHGDTLLHYAKTAPKLEYS